MSKTKVFEMPDGGQSAHIFCPACNCTHALKLKVPQTNGAMWNFDGNVQNPTFVPSLNVKTGSYAVPSFIDPEGLLPTICHSIIKNGQIEYCGDCTHKFAGQTLTLPEINE